MAQPDPRNWAVSDVLAIHGAFKNSVDLLDIADKGIGGTLSITGVLSAVNATACPRVRGHASPAMEVGANQKRSQLEKLKRRVISANWKNQKEE
eukprot:g53219.t1